MAGDGRACIGCEAGFPLYSMASTSCQGWSLLPSCWSRSPESWAWAGSVPSKSMFFFSPHTGNFAPKEDSAQPSGTWCAFRDTVLCLCRHLQLYSDVAQSCLLVVTASDLALPMVWSECIRRVYLAWAGVHSKVATGVWQLHCYQKSGLLWGHCLSKCHQWSPLLTWATPQVPGSCLGPRSSFSRSCPP